MDFPSQVGDDEVEVSKPKNNLAFNDILVVEFVVAAFNFKRQKGPPRAQVDFGVPFLSVVSQISGSSGSTAP